MPNKDPFPFSSFRPSQSGPEWIRGAPEVLQTNIEFLQRLSRLLQHAMILQRGERCLASSEPEHSKRKSEARP